MKREKLGLVAATVGASIILLLLAAWLGLRVPPAGRLKGGADPPAGDAHSPTAIRERPLVHDFGPPDEWFVAGAVGRTYTETVSGAGLRTGETSVLLGQAPLDGPYAPGFAIGRAYAGWDTAALPDSARVLSATLVLDPPAGGGVPASLEIVVYRGSWSSPIDLEAWRSPGRQAVGRWSPSASQPEERKKRRTARGIVLYEPEPARTDRVPLDPAVVKVDGLSRLELRHPGEDVPLAPAGFVPLGPSQITLEVVYKP